MSTEFFNDQWRIPSNENQNKISNYSMEFDGASTTNVNVGNLSAIQGTSTFSISAWVNLDNTGQQRIFGSWEATTSKRIVGFGIYTGSRLLLQVSDDGSSFDQLLSTSTLTANTWTHVVVTFSNGVANFYINGASAGSDTSTTVTNIYNVSNDYFIGSFISSTTIPFGGKMDQLTIFDYALSQDQVTQLGAEGYAFNFDGTDYITAPTTNFGAGDLAVSLWFNQTAGTNYQGMFAGSNYQSSNGNEGFIIYARNTGIEIWYQTASNAFSNIFTLPSVYVLNSWKHVCLVREFGVGWTVYLDGVVAGTNTISGSISVGLSSPTSAIGRNFNSNLFFNGEISNVSTFNTNLLSADVQTLYNNGRPGDISSLNPEGWWKLDDTATFNSGTIVWTIPDASTNSNTGASVGMNASSLVASNIDGELISNPMALNPKPVAYYQLGDQSANNGTKYLVPNNSLGGYVFRFIASPLNTSGYTSGDILKTPSGVDTILAGATSMTISFWVNLNPTLYPNGTIFQTAGITIRFLRYGNVRGPVFTLSMSDGTTSTPPPANSGVAARPNFYNTDFLPNPSTAGSNTWHMLTCTWDGSTARIYRDAASQVNRSDAPYTGTILNSQTGMNFGTNLAETLFLNGYLSNIAIWRNTALTANEVSEVYNNGTPLDLNDFSGNAPTSWWKLNAGDTFDGSTSTWTIKDQIGNVDMTSFGMNSTNLVTSNLILGNVGYSPYTLSLDKANSNFFNCGSDTSLQATTALTISAWVRYSDTATTNRFGIVSRQDSSLNASYELVLENDGQNSRSLIFRSTGSGSLSSTGIVQRSVWTHVAVTLDSAGTTIYIGGVPAGASSAITLSSFPNCNFLIANSTYSNSFFPGSLSNIAVWNNTALSPTEILELQNQGLPGNLHNFSGTAPTSWWQMGTNSSFDNATTKWTCLDEVGINNALSSANMTNDDIINGPGYSANGLGSSTIDVVGDAPYSTANGLSENMSVSSRKMDVPD